LVAAPLAASSGSFTSSLALAAAALVLGALGLVWRALRSRA
ncbi:MAG: MFS transporter, partial [Paraburkholderia tropica]